MSFQRENYRNPQPEQPQAPRKPRRILVGADLPPYMLEKLPTGPDTCPFCNEPITDDIREAAAHILGCARDEKKQGALKGKARK